MATSICGVQFNDRQRAKDLMLMFGLMETTDQLAVSSSVQWYGDVSCHVSRRALDCG